MGNDLKVGDTICCSGYSDMCDVTRTLRKLGYICTVGVGYTIRIDSVPIQDQVEQDGFITWE